MTSEKAPRAALSPVASARFSSKTVTFLNKAVKQTDPDWLAKHEKQHQDHVVAPLQALAQALIHEVQPVAPGYYFPNRGLGRVKRANGDTLYRNYLSYTASRKSASRFEKNPSLYFGIHAGDPDDPFVIAAGLYMPSSYQMRAIREAIVGNPAWLKRLEHLFGNAKFRARFGKEFSDERVQTRPPRGFTQDHPRAAWLKLQGFYVWRSYSPKEVAASGFLRRLAADCRLLLPLNDLLEEVAASTWTPKGRAVRPLKKAPAGPLSDRLSNVEGPRHAADF